ncbi:uncharacterized protein MCYG_07016 [Microsporum canis CBS 113480]|uniref:Uncharacterized protein n=1 Tax=Arthroderma otae (strain ATCC MYA-4605 / CBS 113480) TaxID=554155 RepID=C5FWB3_ARTOC|nr:uncharacterized protein MCYG_07016 [Microsporum canis CBS 113480]EEQ34197.1 predicted protein [Microsporum canis CBS 113480]
MSTTITPTSPVDSQPYPVPVCLVLKTAIAFRPGSSRQQGLSAVQSLPVPRVLPSCPYPFDLLDLDAASTRSPTRLKKSTGALIGGSECPAAEAVFFITSLSALPLPLLSSFPPPGFRPPPFAH